MHRSEETAAPEHGSAAPIQSLQHCAGPPRYWRPAGGSRIGSLLTGGAANGLYTLAGVILTLQTRSLRGGLLVWTWAVWAAGVALTATSVAGSLSGMMVSTSALMILFCPWAWVMRRALR